MSGQVLSFPERPSPNEPSIIFGRALILNLARRASALTGIPLEDLLGPRGIRDVAHTRFAVMKVAREGGKSMGQIGRVLGNRDHTSVLHGINRAGQLEAADPDFAELVRLLREEAGR